MNMANHDEMRERVAMTYSRERGERHHCLGRGVRKSACESENKGCKQRRLVMLKTTCYMHTRRCVREVQGTRERGRGQDVGRDMC